MPGMLLDDILMRAASPNKGNILSLPYLRSGASVFLEGADKSPCGCGAGQRTRSPAAARRRYGEKEGPRLIVHQSPFAQAASRS
jgi:hypothetical protein